MTNNEIIEAAYRAFNARDIGGLFVLMVDDVVWPNGWEGGMLTGKPDIREYWTRQWSEINPNVDPVDMTELPDGRVKVNVHQVVKNLDGEVVADIMILHVFTIRDGKITRMNIEPE